MTVESQVQTDAKGRSEWTIRSQITAPMRFVKGAIYGAGFAIESSTN